MTDTTQTPPAPAAGGAPPSPVAPAPAPPASLDPAVMYPDQGAKAPDPSTPPAPEATPPAAAEGAAKEGEGGFLSPKDGEAPKPDGEAPPSTPFDATALKFKEGFEIAPAMMESFSTIAKEAGLSTEAAQKLLDLQTSFQETSLAESREIIVAQDKEWKAELEKDPEFAGSAGVAVRDTIASMISQFGSPEVVQVFDAYGLSNNPALVRCFAKMGKALSEGRPTSTGAPRVNGGVTTQANAPLPTRLYPAHYNEAGQPKQ